MDWDKFDIEILEDNINLIDNIKKDKKGYSNEKIFLHDIQFSGISPKEKFKQVFDLIESKFEENKLIGNLNNNNLKGLIINRLDNIACIFFY